MSFPSRITMETATKILQIPLKLRLEMNPFPNTVMVPYNEL
jgi:hypothetical protein